MRKLTLLFLASALGASVMHASDPKFKVGDEVPFGGKVLIVTAIDENGEPLFKTKEPLKKEKKKSSTHSFIVNAAKNGFNSVFGGEEEEEKGGREELDDRTDKFIVALREELKRQGKEPCDTCYTMMEPDDPRIPEDYCISLTGCAPGTNMYGE